MMMWLLQFLMPFSLELWMAILGSSTLVALVFFFMDYTSRTDRRFTVKETIWFCIGKAPGSVTSSSSRAFWIAAAMRRFELI